MSNNVATLGRTTFEIISSPASSITTELPRFFPRVLDVSLKVLGISPLPYRPPNTFLNATLRKWRCLVVTCLNIFCLYYIIMFLLNAYHNCEVLIELMHLIQGGATTLTVNMMLSRKREIWNCVRDLKQQLAIVCPELQRTCYKQYKPWVWAGVGVFWSVGISVLVLDVMGSNDSLFYSNDSCKAVSEPRFIQEYQIHTIADIFGQNYMQNGIYALMLIPLILCSYIRAMLSRLRSQIRSMPWEQHTIDPATEICRIGHEYLNIQQLVNRFNDTFSPLIMLWMFLFFVTFAMRGGSFIGDIQGWRQNGGIPVMVICSVITIVVLMLIIWVFASIHDETRRIVTDLSPLLYKIPPSNREFHWKLQLLMTLLFFQPCSVTAWNLFVVTRGLMLTLSGALCTYALLIIQFYTPSPIKPV